MTLPKVLTVVMAVSCLAAFTSLGDEFRNAIVGVSGLELGSTAAAAGEDLGLPDLDGMLNAGDAFDAPVVAAEPTLGEGVELGGQNAAAQETPTSLEPGTQANTDGGEAYQNEQLIDKVNDIDLGGLFSWDNFALPALSVFGGVVAGIVGAALPVKIGAVGSLVFGAGAKALLASAGAMLAKLPFVAASVVGLVGLKAVLIVGGIALVAGGLGYGIYKGYQYLKGEGFELFGSGDNNKEQVQQGQIDMPETEMPTAEEAHEQIDLDGDGVSLEDEIAAEGDVEVPDLPGVDDGAEEAPEPAAPAANTAAEKFADSLINGEPSEARDTFQKLLADADSKSDAEVAKQAKEILDFLSINGYGGNSRVQQWTEEALMMGYDPRLPLALVKQSRTGEYSTALLNDFGGAWNALSDDGEIYDIIDQLGNCGGGPSCASATTNMAHGYVSGNGPRLSANPDARANEMTRELIEAIEMYLPGDAIALHTAESIRPLLDTYPR